MIILESPKLISVGILIDKYCRNLFQDHEHWLKLRLLFTYKATPPISHIVIWTPLSGVILCRLIGVNQIPNCRCFSPVQPMRADFPF